MPRLAAAYTPKRLPVPFPGIKRQLGETYLESRLGETHLEHECRRETPRPADLSPYLNKLTRVRLSSPASQVHSGPLPSPSEPHLISPPKSGPRQAATPNRKSALKSKEAEGCTIDPFHRRNQRHDQSVSERDASNGEVQTTHPCTPTCPCTPTVNSKPKNMLLMIRNGDRPSQSLRAETRGLDSKSDSFLVTVTHG